MFLLDTNVWLERLLEQQRSEEVRKFLDKISSENIYITDFSFHSIAIVLIKLQKKESLLKFIQDAFIEGSVNLINMEPIETENIITIVEKFGLDFDDGSICMC
jgi:predicted nucleic acid-binding protein